MSKSIFAILFFIILVLAIFIRIIPASGNNFYFTMDQGNDAVYVREIVQRHKILLKGPETGIKGVYHGVLWYYFIAIGYLLFNGHPFGSIFMLILLNICVTAFLMIVIEHCVSRIASLTVGLFLQLYWWFYDASRYGFNPFPLVALSLFLIVFLSLFKRGKEFYYVLAVLPIGLAFNSEMAGAIAFFALFVLFTFKELVKKQLNFKVILVTSLVFSSFFIPRIISEFQTNFSQQKTLLRELKESEGTFSDTNFQPMTIRFKEILVKRIIPQSDVLGISLFTIMFLIFLKTPRKNFFVKKFTYYSLALVSISYLWFASNLGWRSWHTVYVRPLFFVTLVLMALSINKKVGIVVLGVIFVTQSIFFKTRYMSNLHPTSDQSILANEIAAIDWVYKNSNGQGFYVYSYLPSVLDYPYQYLFWWYGRKEYGYLPCEYSTFPKTPSMFVPGEKYYQEPKRECSNLTFLIIEPDDRTALRDKWLSQVSRNTMLLDGTQVGRISIEKRALMP